MPRATGSAGTCSRSARQAAGSRCRMCFGSLRCVIIDGNGDQHDAARTVIVTGTYAQGAVAGTTNGAAQRGYKAVVPVDCLSAEDAFNELYAVWHIYKGGPVNLTSNATLTRSDLITFGG